MPRLAPFLAVLAAAVLASASPASADWQFTKWGMTPDQVVKASKGAAIAPTADDAKSHGTEDGSETVKLAMPYDTGTFGFTAFFSFDRSDHLCRVTLDLVRGDPGSLLPALRSKYGNPLTPDANVIDWVAGSDHIVGMVFGASAEVDYRPRAGGASTGL